MKKILIANRGEIAVRIIRTAKEMGITTVAVYSSADIASPHVTLADEAYFVGEAPSNQSYLRGDKIIQLALEHQVDGIHPGYGFLSENAEFAQKVSEAGIKFIGPMPYAIEIMGNKLAAKDAVSNYNIPMLAGTKEAITDIDLAREIALKVGYPILVKAAAGGGGKGMRVVNEPNELEEQMIRAISEAQSAFGDGSVFIEKYIANPRHIEIQVLFDSHGNGIYLFERDCSIQRRHQKVIEEAPSAILSSELREKMGQAALDVGKACNYEGAGTVEFLVDETLNFYFLEMNTRLQVEHPVTEMITGLDLVKEQIEIARGKKLSFEQKDLKIRGHAIELRLYAEDPANNFLPFTGNLKRYRPADGLGVRVDSGFEEGMDIPVHYDPMIAKIINHAENREAAINKMIRVIDEFEIEGIATTLPFGKFVLQHPAFVSGKYSTSFVGEHFSADKLSVVNSENEQIAAIAALYLHLNKKKDQKLDDSSNNKHTQEWMDRRWI